MSFRFLVPLLCIISASPTVDAQDRPDLCDTDSLVISTGWDRLADTVEVVEQQDPYWTMHQYSMGSTMEAFLPDRAPIIPYSRMVSLGNSRWIGSRPRVGDSISLEYAFSTRFCLSTTVNKATIDCSILATGGIEMTINDFPVLKTEPRRQIGPYDPAQLRLDITGYLHPGLNAIRIRIDERNGPVAIAVEGAIKVESDQSELPFVCDACGQVVPHEIKR